MARLNKESQHHSSAQSADEILSQQHRSCQGKELVAPTQATPEQSLHHTEIDSASEEAHISPREYEYNSSASSTRQSLSDIFGREMDEGLEQMTSRASSRSSLSSVPASVLVHSCDQAKPTATDTYENLSEYIPDEDEARFGELHQPPLNMHPIRYREAAFRKPSSVRAMQMHTEDEADDDEYLTPPRRRTGMRSPGSSPLKPSPYYSPGASASKRKAKKEYPLVLLHCNLLPPFLPISGAADPQNQKVLEDILPPLYWKRWERLQEKVGSGVVRDRGVLISHPEDMYDLLEERLLETLELQRPRLHNGHFLGHEDSGPGSEGEVSDSGESETDGEQGDECPDCGGRVFHLGDSNRKWEIRVYAANGLMRAGAWAAAWKEMEKVDVEVGLWVPSEVRRDLERALSKKNLDVLQDEPRATTMSDTEKHVSRELQQPSIQGHAGPARVVADCFSSATLPSGLSAADSQPMPRPGIRGERKEEGEIALQTLLINYIRVLAGDRRNVALVFLSILVAYLAIGSHHRQPASFYSVMRPFAHDILESSTTPSVSATNNPSASFPEAAYSVEAEDTRPSSQMISIPVHGTVVPPPSKESLNGLSDSVQSSATSMNPGETTSASSVVEDVKSEARPVLGKISAD